MLAGGSDAKESEELTDSETGTKEICRDSKDLTHTKEDKEKAELAMKLVYRLSDQEAVRAALGNAGLIPLLVKQASGKQKGVNHVDALNTLCLCSKEAVNRVKIQDNGGLEVMMSALKGDEKGGLKSGKFRVLYDRIISSLVNFLYSEDGLLKLLEMGLVDVLLQHLRRCSEFVPYYETYTKDTEELANSLLKDFDSKEIERKKIINFEEESPNKIQKNYSNNVEHSTFSMDSSEHSNNVDIISSDVDPLIIDQDKNMHVDVEKKEDSKNPELESETSMENDCSLPGPSSNRHVFSINSPTYQSETSWRLEDYTQGVTCKNFRDPVAVPINSPQSSLDSQSYSVFSPLSANVSYYSPGQSSPSFSQSLSPAHSFSSPASSPGILLLFC